MKVAIDPVHYDVVLACEQLWRQNGAFPSLRELRSFTGQTVGALGEILEDEVVNKHLTARGIVKPPKVRKEPSDSEGTARHLDDGTPNKMHERLTDKQLAVVSMVLNPADKRTLTSKLESVGVAPTTYYGWKKNKVFAKFLRDQAKNILGDYEPEILAKLTENAMLGDFSSQKLALEITGRYKRTDVGNNTQNVQALVMALIETVQRHVKDPATLRAIAGDFKALTTSAPRLTETTPPQMVPVELTELENTNGSNY